jgi:hypothetical protein
MAMERHMSVIQSVKASSRPGLRPSASKALLAALILTGIASGGPVLITRPALACGDSELAISCSANSVADDARWMLKRVSATVKEDASKAFDAFGKGENGFRTSYSYAFCVGPDGKVTAHPQPALLGREVSEIEEAGRPFFDTELLDIAQEGTISEIRYDNPDVPAMYVTRVAGQVCGIGYF